MISLSAEDGDANRDAIQQRLDRTSNARVVLPAGRFPITGGLVLRAGRSLRGAYGWHTPRTVLTATSPSSAPIVHMVGGRTRLRHLAIEVPAAKPGIHDGARFTAVTVGDYLYPTLPEWIEDIEITGVRILRASRCPANSIAIMGAVRDIVLDDVEISGGGTGVAVHWGAVGSSVADIVGPSFHPHQLRIEQLRVTDAFEGFYLSSVHDVTVSDVICSEVEIGFRLLPGDNADRFHEDPESSQVSRRISVARCDVGWRGMYGVRVAGWGRSEVDRHVSKLAYQDVAIESCRFTAGPPVKQALGRPRTSVVVESAETVRFANVDLGGDPKVTAATVDGQAVPLSVLLSANR